MPGMLCPPFPHLRADDPKLTGTRESLRAGGTHKERCTSSRTRAWGVLSSWLETGKSHNLRHSRAPRRPEGWPFHCGLRAPQNAGPHAAPWHCPAFCRPALGMQPRRLTLPAPASPSTATLPAPSWHPAAVLDCPIATDTTGKTAGRDDFIGTRPGWVLSWCGGSEQSGDRLQSWLHA